MGREAWGIGARREAGARAMGRGVRVVRREAGRKAWSRSRRASARVDELRNCQHVPQKQWEPASIDTEQHKITVVLLVNRRFGPIEKVSNCQFRIYRRARRLAPYCVKRRRHGTKPTRRFTSWYQAETLDPKALRYTHARDTVATRWLMRHRAEETFSWNP